MGYWSTLGRAIFAPSSLEAASYGQSDSLSSEGGWFLRALGGRTKAGPVVNENTALNLPVVYSAVSLIAEAIAQLPLVLMKKTDEGSVPAEDHPLYYVLHDDPNEHMTSITWRSTKQHHALLWGNGYSEIERTNGNQVVGLWPLLPDRTRPRKDQNFKLWFDTNIDGTTYALPAENVLHIPALSFDGYLGISPIAKARQAVGMGLATEEFGSKFFANDAKSGGFLLHPGKLSSTAKANLGARKGENKESPAAPLERQGGLENAHRVKVLEEGMKFIATSIAPEDAQFLGTREFQIAEIARIFRVPLVLLASHEKTTSWGSGIEQLIIGFIVWTLQPWLKRWEEELNRKLLSKEDRRAGYKIKFNLNALLRGDMRTRAAFYESGIRNKWLLPNEAREKEDMNRLEGGDEFPDVKGVAPGGFPSEPTQPAEEEDDEPTTPNKKVK